MPQPYRASDQQLFGQTGGPPVPRGPQIDVGGAIDALSGGAASLIHATMLKKQAEASIANQQQERALQAQRNQIEDDRYERESEERALQARRTFMINGGVPGTDTYTPSPTTASVPTVPQGPIARAMQPSVQSTPVPGTSLQTGALAPSITPTAPPPTLRNAPLPASTTQRTTTPDTVDPTKSAGYIRSTETARIRGEVMQEVQGQKDAEAASRQQGRIEANKNAAVAAHAGAMELERLRLSGKQSGAIKRQLTPNALANTAAATADGLIAAHNGNRQEAYEWLNSEDPEAKHLRQLEPNLPLNWGTYLDNARAKWAKTATTQALSFQHGSGGDSPDEATTRVDSTRRIIGRSGKAGADSTGTAATSAAPSPAAMAAAGDAFRPPQVRFAPPPAGAPVATPAAPVAAPVAAPAPKKVSSKPAPAPAKVNDFKDDELADAYDALATGGKAPSDQQIIDYINAQRKTKKPAGKK